MKLKESARVIKGMLFAGCSFTWGQGLYYYSSLPTLGEPAPDCYDPALVTEAHKEFMRSVRYPRIVADHFKTWEVVHPFNGGSNFSAWAWWKGHFENDGSIEVDVRAPWMPKKTFNFNEFSHITFQLTQWQRNNFIVEWEGKTHQIPFACVNQDEYRDIFIGWLAKQNLDLEVFIERYIEQNIMEVKEFLQHFEANGVKAALFTWIPEYLKYIENDPWLKERFITLDYKGQTYKTIEELMRNNREMEIKYDYEHFDEPPKDHHPSLGCHKVMAENVIRHWESR